ncbi:hypothetical protein NA56DRAFT_725877 [Hyaloscypha hepaticicola]|uniref:Uncharacterized protein n=1 Tax=Hyaloscypha hepaticicola TaxID=2082293 RepID=A0A2J6QLA7_9HELO|nr:hypothetical protein NA56DRAFT_725877 [Hyaloscypha hepaticicola]
MLYQKLTNLAVLFFQTSLVRPAVLRSDYLDTIDDDAFNNTLDGRDDTHPLNPAERGMLDNQNNAYEGIFWDTAYPGGMRQRKLRGLRMRFQEDRPFNKFFVRNSVAPIGGRWTSSKDAQNAYASIRHNMLLPSKFPLDGTGNRKRPSRIGYQCKDTEYLPAGNKGCAGTMHVFPLFRVIDKAHRWTIVFCPKFFTDLKYLSEILALQRVAETDLGSLNLVSYEQIILYEWLHNDIMGYSEHLTDLVDTIDDNGPKRKIYGMSEARDYAWKFMKGNRMTINKNVVANVEKYVWYFVDKMYGN